MRSPYLALSARIRKELQEIERVASRCLDIWSQSEVSGDDRYIDGVALNLQSFYTGLERILELVMAEMDQSRPTGANWHQELLRQASTPIPDLRPAVISDALRSRLDRYRGFRHVVRSVYSFNLDREQIAPLVTGLGEVLSQVKAELIAFADILIQDGEQG